MKPRITLTIFFTLIIAVSTAQKSQVMYFMDLPQNHFLNPALRSSSSLYIGLPGLTGINFNITNNFVNFSDVFAEGLMISESTIPFLNPDFNRDKFLGKLKDLNYVEPNISVQLLSLGIDLNSGLYVFLDINDNADLNLVFPRDLLRLAFVGNEELTGQTFDLTDMGADFSYYREIGIGASKNITPRLRLGAKAKLLFGITAGTFRSNALNLTVNNDYSNTLEADMAFDVSGPVHFNMNSENQLENIRLDSASFETSRGFMKFFTNLKNPGFGLDLGAQYSFLNGRIMISAAITDLGFIRWKDDISNLEAKKDIQLSGLDFEDIYEGTATIDELIENMTDSIAQAFHFAENARSFSTMLPTGVAIGGKYNLNDKFSFGILSYSKIIGRQLKEALTVSANMNIGNIVSASLAYTACNNNYSNIGLGFAARASVAQFYFLVDRIPVIWKRAGNGDGSFPLPANWNTLHTRFGINLVFGNKARINQ